VWCLRGGWSDGYGKLSFHFTMELYQLNDHAHNFANYKNKRYNW